MDFKKMEIIDDLLNLFQNLFQNSFFWIATFLNYFIFFLFIKKNKFFTYNTIKYGMPLVVIYFIISSLIIVLCLFVQFFNFMNLYFENIIWINFAASTILFVTAFIMVYKFSNKL